MSPGSFKTPTDRFSYKKPVGKIRLDSHKDVSLDLLEAFILEQRNQGATHITFIPGYPVLKTTKVPTEEEYIVILRDKKREELTEAQDLVDRLTQEMKEI